MLDPTVRFTCRNCTSCCNQPWQTLIEPEKAARLTSHDFGRYPQIAGRAFWHPADAGTTGKFVLAKGEGNRCLFLDHDGLCIIHKELGAEAKPDMCRQFPFLPARTWTEDRVSCNYGCPAVQGGHGPRLDEQAEEIAAVAPVSKQQVKPDAGVPLTSTCKLTRREADALFERAMALFDEEAGTDIWACFAGLLSLLVATQHRKCGEPGGQSSALEEWLRSGSGLSEASLPEVAAYPTPAQAPPAVRFLFAATLFPDTLPSDATASMGFLRRLTLVPRLMALARLSGTYASRLLGRNVSVSAVLNAPVGDVPAPEGTRLLKRYYRSRLWQSFPAGTRLPIIAGVHQHIQDLNAVLFYARAEALETHVNALDGKLVAGALTRVEFHLANQVRLHEHTLKGWFRAQLEDPAAAFAGLRLMARRQAAASVS